MTSGPFVALETFHTTSKARQQMRTFFSTWLAVFGKPFLNKNNRNTICMDLLSTVLDNVWFIVVHRDPLYVAQSLLLSREYVQGDRAIGWGLGTYTSSNQILDPLEDIAAQVARIHQDLAAQRQRCDHTHLIDVPYEQFCADPDYFIQTIFKTVWDVEGNPMILKRLIQPFQNANQVRLPRNEFNQLQEAIEQRVPMP